MSDFPQYFAHRDARCFACGGELSHLDVSGNAPGHGAFRGRCRCGVNTWYDCAEGPVEMIDLNVCRGEQL